jgi:hypothetical protein
VKQLLFLPLLLVTPILTMERADARTAAATTVSTISRGVKLSVTVPRRVYPNNALIIVELSIRNVSRHPVLMSGNNAPTVLAQTPGGVTLFDASYPIPNQRLPSTPYISPWPLYPGKVWKVREFVVVRGPYLQPVVNLVVGPSGPEVTVRGRRLHLRLFRAASPTVTIIQSPSPHVRVTPTMGARGTPYVTFGGRWGPIDASGYHWHVDWVPFDPRHLAPCDICGAVALFGYLGYPARTIHFRGAKAYRQ